MRTLWVRLGLAAFLFASLVHAQGTIQQAGPIVPFHVPSFYQNGVVGDGGTPQAPLVSSLGLFNGANCPFGVSSQTGPGTSFVGGAQFSVCQTASATTLAFLGTNGQAAPAVYFNIGGVSYPFPGPGNGNVIGPGLSVSGHIACFNTTSGAVLEDCGAGLPLPVSNGGTGATSASAALLALGGAPIASPTFTGAVTIPQEYLTSAPGYLTLGNQTPVAGGVMRQDWVQSDWVTNPDWIGGIWSAPTYAYSVLDRTVTNSTISGQVSHGAPVIDSLDMITNNGALNDAVATMSICAVKVSSRGCFGGNDISTGIGSIPMKLVGREIDVEFPIGATDAGGSIGLALNVFTAAAVSPAYQLGGISGGSWANGGAYSGVSSSGSDLIDLSGDASSFFINTLSRTSFGTAFAVLGSGVGNGIAWGGSVGGVNPFIYGDSGGNFIVQPGVGNFIVKDRSGANNIFVVTQSTSTKAIATASTMRTTATTFSGLSTQDPSPAEGDRAFITDNNSACTFMTAASGGGTTHCPVVYVGSQWVAG